MRASIHPTHSILAFLVSTWWSASAWAEYLVSEVGLRFPDTVASVALFKGSRYPQAALGHGIEYRGPGFAGSMQLFPAADGVR